MQTFSLPGIRLVELANVVDSIQPKDLGDLKSIRLAAGLVNDLKTALKEIGEKGDALAIKQRALAAPFQERYQKESPTLSEVEQKTLATQLDKELSELVQTSFKADIEEYNTMGQQVIEVSLGDEKFEKLQELFKKYAAEKYLNKEVLVQVADALKV